MSAPGSSITFDTSPESSMVISYYDILLNSYSDAINPATTNLIPNEKIYTSMSLSV